MEFSQTIYTSTAVRPFSDAELRELLGKARERNTAIEVSGVLLHQGGTFLQVLEGEADRVGAVYERIGRDARHRDVLLLHRRAVTERNFGDWSMGFVDIGGRAASLPGFRQGVALADLVGERETIDRVVHGFTDGRWHRAISASSARR
jgi:hypothetical protein